MKEIKIMRNSKDSECGANILDRDPISGNMVYALMLNERHDVLNLHRKLSEFIGETYELPEPEVRYGIYRHYKEGDEYLVYDKQTDEETQMTRISYESLKDGKKYSRFASRFFENVEVHPENNTGQKLRFEFDRRFM